MKVVHFMLEIFLFLSCAAMFNVKLKFVELLEAAAECKTLQRTIEHPDLKSVFLVLVKWCKEENATGIGDGKLLAVHVCLPILQYLTEISEKKISFSDAIRPPSRIAEYLLEFIKYFGREEFRNKESVRFLNLDSR